MTVAEFLHEYQLAIPVVVGLVAWVANESRKRAVDNLRRREDHYLELLSASEGFQTSGNLEQREKFLAQVRAAWLHCPAEVVRKINAFLDAMHEGSVATPEERESRLRELALAMRQDLAPWYRTDDLTAADFKLLRVNRK